MPVKIEMFSDFICPFCYIGFATVRNLKREFDLEIAWRGFEIHPEWPAAGMPAAEYRTPAVREQLWTRIASMAEALGLALNPPAMLYSSRLALEANEFAIEIGKGEPFQERVYRAYFVEGRNIAQTGVLTELAAEVGIEPRALTVALESQRYSLRLKNHAMVARNRGVDGVPTFFIGDYPLVGAQSEETMRQILGRYIDKLGASK